MCWLEIVSGKCLNLQWWDLSIVELIYLVKTPVHKGGKLSSPHTNCDGWVVFLYQ